MTFHEFFSITSSFFFCVCVFVNLFKLHSLIKSKQTSKTTKDKHLGGILPGLMEFHLKCPDKFPSPARTWTLKLSKLSVVPGNPKNV